MPALPDYLYLAVFAVAAPLYSYVVFWPAFLRRAAADPAGARRRLWLWNIPEAWALTAAGAAIWAWHDRPWTALGFAWPAGWRAWVAAALVLALAGYLAYAVLAVRASADAREGVRAQAGPFAAILPHTRSDMALFAAVSLTAGFCEEFLFRGYFIWVLSPWLGWWGAAGASALAFACAHAYQGREGMLRTGIAALVFTLVVALLDSLWPAIALHALLDLGMGWVAWVAVREGKGG